ncbi:MAG: hypothetical protein Q8K86_09975 [Candidatus Nanopelagicaceae bacterium]|nr:hypothetical protein [Candidatus Nanopelagicaceae bacterium]
MNKRFVGALGTVILGAGLITGIGTYVSSAKNDSRVLAATPAGTIETSQGELPHYTLDLSAYPDSMAGSHGKDGGANPGWVTFGPGTNYEVPAHSAITITIKQYDGGETITNDFFASVRGTVDGMMTVNGEKVTSIPANQIGHTWTLHGLSDGKDQLFVSVPLKAVPDEEMPEEGYSSSPQITTFTFITGDAGEYIWNCEFPCGDGTVARFGAAMSTMGYMSGHFTVVNA